MSLTFDERHVYYATKLVRDGNCLHVADVRGGRSVYRVFVDSTCVYVLWDPKSNKGNGRIITVFTKKIVRAILRKQGIKL